MADDASAGPPGSPQGHWTVSRNCLLIVAGLILAQAITLYAMGRTPICTCGTIKLWHGNVHSSENSQQLLDWYSFSHVLHGFLFYGLAWLVFPRSTFGQRLVLAVGIEAAWEIAENTNMVIERYRSATVSLNYYGDSIVNSLGDMVSMIVGFLLARRLPVSLLAVIFVVIELGLAYGIRDNLTLNIIMLIHPIEAIAKWQAAVPVQ
ncbi:MAG: DUF2585 domain-containing protein [Rhizobiales bacterium]|nr:DUF2585 domain-containing protein [Hyphomicrobiales bacterium]